MAVLGNRGQFAPKVLPKAPASKTVSFKALPASTTTFGGLPARSGTVLKAATENVKHPALQAVKEARAGGGAGKYLRAQTKAVLPKAGPKSAGGLAAILNVPGEVVAKGYANLAHRTGAGALNEVGKLTAEAVNLPTQALPAAYYAGKGLYSAKIENRPQELEHLGHEFLQQSAVAHLFKGDINGAVAAAKAHPLNTGLEVGGGLSALDRTLGAMSRGNLAGKAVDGASTVSREPQALPKGMAPEGGVTVPLKPYDKGLVRAKLEKALEKRQMGSVQGQKALRKNFDQFEAEQLAATRATREMIRGEHHKLMATPGRETVSHFASGLIADPKHLGKDGSPLYRQQLAAAIDHFSKTPEEELPHDAHLREEVVAHLKDVQSQPHQHFLEGHRVAQDIAAKKRALERELEKHGIYTGETMRAAKLTKPFQMHFRDQNPFVDTTVPHGESPFRLGGPEGRQVPVDEVAKKLAAKGVHESQLSFSSTRPFQTESEAFRSGRSAGGKRESTGKLTGAAYARGHFDPSPEALLRQHLKTGKVINEARADREFARRYAFKNSDLADLIDHHLKTNELPAAQKAALARYSHDLRFQNNIYFHQTAGDSAWARAKAAQAHLGQAGIHLEPVRVGHQYATASYRQGLGKHLMDVADLQDRLEPVNPSAEPLRTRVPTEESAQNDPTAGPVALVHPQVAGKIRDYERELGQAHLGRMPGSIWRKGNVAFSVRHIPGVAQELGIRALANNIGLLSGLRGTRALHYLRDYAAAHPDPAVKAGMQRLDANTGGTVASFTSAQDKHIPLKQLEGTRLESPMRWWLKGETHKLTGLPLRAVKGVVKVTSHGTDEILRLERKGLEHPPQIAGAGKHFNSEYRRITGQRLKVIGAMSKVEKAFLRGELDPKALDHAANMFQHYWGEWKSSTPQLRKLQAVSPFLRWYVNSLRFVYHTMPKDHPVQTGLLATLESASREQRLAEGQEYEPGFNLGKGKLPAYLQGSIPNVVPSALNFGQSGERLGAEFYTPPGAVSAGPTETLTGSIFPWASGIYNTLNGVDPVTHRPLEEKNPQTGKKEAITSQGKLALLGALSGLESFAPPVRWGVQASEGTSPAQIFRPFRTEKGHVVGAKKPKEAKLGGSLSRSLGSGLGGSLK